MARKLWPLWASVQTPEPEVLATLHNVNPNPVQFSSVVTPEVCFFGFFFLFPIFRIQGLKESRMVLNLLIAEEDFEFLILLPPPPKYWNYKLVTAILDLKS